MNKELCLKILGKIMNWSDYEALEEFRWLKFMSTYKYDSYNGYLSGVRFLESLATWLQQFEQSDRKIAYDFIKNNLIYFSIAELYRLVEKFFYEQVQPDLVKTVASNLHLPKYRVWASEKSLEEYDIEKRKILYMGLSDGARMDILRRLNFGRISNEQVAVSIEINQAKWDDLFAKLKKDLNDEKINFSNIYLIDDWTASGTTLLRTDNTTDLPKGKLAKFAEHYSSYLKTRKIEGKKTKIIVHHYIGTEVAKLRIEEQIEKHRNFLEKNLIYNIELSFGMLIPEKYRIIEGSDETFAQLCKKYYDKSLEGGHGDQSGVASKIFGYGGIGLPIIMEHNTPNNSLSLLWAQTEGDEKRHSMKALFRRIERHSDLEKKGI